MSEIGHVNNGICRPLAIITGMHFQQAFANISTSINQDILIRTDRAGLVIVIMLKSKKSQPQFSQSSSPQRVKSALVPVQNFAHSFES